MSILRHLHTKIRESILSISLNSRLSRAIGQSPYQSRVLAVTSRCVYRPSVVQLLAWVFVCVFGCFLSIIALQSCPFEGTPPSLPQYIRGKVLNLNRLSRARKNIKNLAFSPIQYSCNSQSCVCSIGCSASGGRLWEDRMFVEKL